MLTKLKPHFTYANVVASIALFAVLGGGMAVAAGLKKNSIGSRQIAPKAVKTSDLAKNAVKSPKVANGTLLSEDFAAGQLPAGEQGPQGLQGPQGESGAAGSPDTPAQVLAKLNAVDNDDSGLNADTLDGHDAECPTANPTFFHRGFCYDTLIRGTTTWSSASDTCSGDSGYLPVQAQLDSIRNVALINLGNDAASAHWTSDVSVDDDGTGLNVLTVQDSGGISSNDDPTTTQQPYRCAYNLVR